MSIIIKKEFAGAIPFPEERLGLKFKVVNERITDYKLTLDLEILAKDTEEIEIDGQIYNVKDVEYSISMAILTSKFLNTNIYLLDSSDYTDMDVTFDSPKVYDFETVKLIKNQLLKELQTKMRQINLSLLLKD